MGVLDPRVEPVVGDEDREDFGLESLRFSDPDCLPVFFSISGSLFETISSSTELGLVGGGLGFADPNYS